VDFRDQPVKEALDKAIGPFRTERTLGGQLARIAVIVALAVATVLGLLAVIHISSPRPGPAAPAAKPRPIEIQLVPGKR